MLNVIILFTINILFFIFLLDNNFKMWILISFVLKTTGASSFIPIYDNPILHNTVTECENSIQQIYDKYKLLQTNYPIELDIKTNNNNQRYLIYSYKPDYTKPKITKYYNCLKTTNIKLKKQIENQ